MRSVARLVALSLAMMACAWAGDGYVPPTTEAFVKGIRGYPFVAPAARREKLRTGVPQLTKCMPAAEVRKLIGDPDFGYNAYKGGIPTRKIWSYVLEKKALKEVDPASRVVLWFDVNGKLNGVTVHGAPDIEASISRRTQNCP